MLNETPFPAAKTGSQPAFHWPSLVQLIFSLLATLAALGLALILTLVGFTQLYGQQQSDLDVTQTFLLAAMLGLIGVLVIPSAWYAGKRLAQGQQPALRAEAYQTSLLWVSLLLIILLPVAVLAGRLLIHTQTLAWFLLPPVNLVATALPVLWLVIFGIRGLPTGSRQRLWGIFASGLAFNPLLIMIIELVAMAVFGMAAMLLIMLNPDANRDLLLMLERLSHAPPVPSIILRIVGPFITQPWVILSLIGFTALVVPLIEELIKPLGVWFLAGRGLTPAEGFTAGVVSGAGFALLENLGNTSSAGDGWGLLVLVRISTALLHILASGLMGWGMVTAWQKRRFSTLLLTYLGVVLLHGLWNTLGVLGAFSSDFPSFIQIPEQYRILGEYSTAGLVILTLVNAGLFIFVKRTLRRSLVIASPALPIPPPGEPALPPAPEKPAESTAQEQNIGG